jgi:hypothetical protein
MKKIFAVLSLICLSSSAFAMHAYATDDCIAKMMKGQTLEIDLANGQPADPHKIVNTNSDEWLQVSYQGDDYKEGSVLVLADVKNANVLSRKTDDGCFQGEERTFTRTAQVQTVSTPVAKTYGLKKGMTLHFVCSGSESYPTGNHCF